MGILSSLFGSKGPLQSIENIAIEWIETDRDSAEAKALVLKALDPNGIMRRELSRRVTTLYTIYMFILLSLIAAEVFGIGNGEAILSASDKVTSLFAPITALFGAIVSVSFGVNYANVKS